MLSDKLKIRISSFVTIILENDAQCFGFVKSDNSSNKNALLNKLIPNMLVLRKERRKSIGELLKEKLNKEFANDIYMIANQVLDNVFYRDEELDDLNDEVWIRPNKIAMKSFDEIEEEELCLTGMDISSYIRSLLNEYAKLPQYKRQSIAFKEELDMIRNACLSGQIIHFRYHNLRYKVFTYQYIYGYIEDQNNYVIGYDIKGNQIRSFLLSDIDDAYLIKQKFLPDDDLLDKLQKYLEEYDYSDNHIVNCGEVRYEK